MFSSIRISLLVFLTSFSGMHAIPDTIKEQVFSFLKGVAPVTVGMGVGYLAGRPIKHQYVTTAIGALGGAALDHYYLGGKEDKNQIARKSGNIVPMIFVGGVLYYNNKKIVIKSKPSKPQQTSFDESIEAGKGAMKRSYSADDPTSVEQDPNLFKDLGKQPVNVKPAPAAAASSSSSSSVYHLEPIDESIDNNDFAILRDAVFAKKGEEYAQGFNDRYKAPCPEAVHELANQIDLCSPWMECYPPRATATVGSQKVYLDGGMGILIYDYRRKSKR